MIQEFCAQNLEHVREALLAGAQRIELCDDLSLGGVSPRDEIIAQATALVHELGGTVMVMVRPRGGDFAYNAEELRAMERVIDTALAAGADGVVFGCTRAGMLDEPATRHLAQAAHRQGLDLTFHMAFDEIRTELQPAALETLANLGFSRVLTHGGPLSEPLERCLPHLRELVSSAPVAQARIAIMPGGGVTWANAPALCEELGVTEVHGTRIVRL